MGNSWTGDDKMRIIIRACSYPSTKPLPFDFPFHDKTYLLKKCFESLKRANDLNVPITVINDGIQNPQDIFGDVEIIDATGAGNIGTFHRQMNEAIKHDKVLLVEDDYLWRDNTISDLFTAIETLSFVSPYDHPGHHHEERFATVPKLIKIIDNITYRECPSNTLTFACQGNKLAEKIDEMKGYAIQDHEMWVAIGGLWCPTYSFATHLVSGLLAPNVNWESYLQTLP